MMNELEESIANRQKNENTDMHEKVNNCTKMMKMQ